MDAPKKIVSCANCGSTVRIPADKHIRFKCPTCGAQHEYRFGELVKVREEPKENPSNEVKEYPYRSRTTATYVTIGVAVLIIIGAIIYLTVGSSEKQPQ